VVSYDLLARIADGLGIPRGSLGLAYDDATAALLGLARPASPGETPEEPAQVAGRLGGLTVDPLSWGRPFPPVWSVAPERIGQDDVGRFAAATQRLRALDREHGGGACHDAAVAQLGWAQQLLRARADEATRQSVHRAVADLHV